jgi:DNA-binding NarL/FixJ family response regulator
MNKDQAPPYHSLLVIDDHNMIVNGIRLLIGDWFSVFYHANDGATGIRLALEHQPQLVIVDQVLPDHSGDAVAGRSNTGVRLRGYWPILSMSMQPPFSRCSRQACMAM